MSYYASISKSSFYVSTENTGRVLAKLQRLPYQLQLDYEGNITGIEMSHCPIGNDYPIFQEIAPYVRDKSFILFSFENGKCRKVVPQIIWGE